MYKRCKSLGVDVGGMIVGSLSALKTVYELTRTFSVLIAEKVFVVSQIKS